MFHLRDPARVFRNDRTGTENRPRAAASPRLLHADTKLFTTTRHHALHCGQSPKCRLNAGLPIRRRERRNKGEAIAEIAAMKRARLPSPSQTMETHRNRKLTRQVHGLLQLSRFAGDRTLGRRFARRRSRYARRLTSTRLGLRGMARAAESVCVARDVQLAELPGGRVTSPIFLREGRSTRSLGQSRGLRVTCEVTPPPLHFDRRRSSSTIRASRLNPPLRRAKDREALIAALADGAVDAIATDHAPHEPALKDVEFDRAPFGFSVLKRRLRSRSSSSSQGKNLADAHGRALHHRPARILGKKRNSPAGQPADVTSLRKTHEGSTA